MKVKVKKIMAGKTVKRKLNKTLVKVLKYINDISIPFDDGGPYMDVDENFAAFEYHVKGKPIRITVNMIEPYIKKAKKSEHAFIKTGKPIKIKKKRRK